MKGSVLFKGEEILLQRQAAERTNMQNTHKSG